MFISDIIYLIFLMILLFIVSVLKSRLKHLDAISNGQIIFGLLKIIREL